MVFYLKKAKQVIGTQMLKNPEEFFRKLAPNIVFKYRKHIFDDAKDVYGKSFSSKYSPGYKAIKAATQTGGYKSNAPVLRGDLRLDLSVIQATPGGFEIGWTTHGGKIKWLNKVGRKITTKDKPLPTPVIKFIDDELSKQWKIENPNKTTKHKVKLKIT